VVRVDGADTCRWRVLKVRDHTQKTLCVRTVCSYPLDDSVNDFSQSFFYILLVYIKHLTAHIPNVKVVRLG